VATAASTVNCPVIVPAPRVSEQVGESATPLDNVHELASTLKPTPVTEIN
jgi:hypothetical protein